MRKNLKRFMSIFLSTAMAVTIIPSTTYAMEEIKNDYEFSSDNVSIEYEIESKRTENSKTYMTDDGGYYQVSADVPIHNKVNGKWEEISEIDKSIKTAEDAENAVSEIATQSVSNPTETGLYYGQKRYYSPSWGRFINASDPTTLTENMSSVYNTNLFNYCGNDPVNNITKTGFNAPDQIISDAFVPQLVNSTNSLMKENRSTAKYYGEISTGLDILSLGLRKTTDTNAKNYWNETLKKRSDVVGSGYGFNYIESAINKTTSSVTKYSVNEMNTPYRVSKSIN